MMDQPDRSNPASTHRRVDNLKALLLSLAVGAVGTIFLLSILGRGAVVFASEGENTLNNLRDQALDSITAAIASTSVQITKTVEPTNPDTGGMVNICFTIGGLGPQRVDVVLAQDVSRSMSNPVEEGVTQTRLAASQAAACAFVNSLPSMDRAGVVSYSTIAYVAQPLTTTKSSVTRTIYALTVAGGTNIGEGISVSHKELMTSSRYLTYTAKTIILLSDGKATLPEGNADEYAKEQAQTVSRGGIKIYTIGFGSDADEGLLQELADIGGGRYFFAPDADVLETIYMTIALELHNLVITDILPSGVEVDCSSWPDGWCITGPSGVTTLTFPISNTLLISDPAVICFTATVNLDPNREGPINLPGSGICYQDSEGQTVCEEFVNPTIRVGGRKIMGHVFYDENTNGRRDAGETGAPDVTVRTSTGVTTRTNASGSYVLRTSAEPAISVSVDIPPGYDATTSTSKGIPAATGTYTVDFGIVELGTRMELYLPIITRNYPPPPIIVNGGFEDGWTGWTHGGKLAQTVTSTNPASGGFSALLGDPTYECEGNVPAGSAWVEQTVVLPSSITSPTLYFKYNIFTQDKNPYLQDEYDRFDVRVGNTLVFSDARRTGQYGCDLDSEGLDLHWKDGKVDLSVHSGQQIRIRFENRSTSDYEPDFGWYNTWTFVDDVRIEPANGW